MSEINLQSLRAIAQFNADLADALHAASSPLCIYLLNMRDFFRWERRVPFDQALPRAELGAWISSREAHWDTLRGDADGATHQIAYRPLFPKLSDDPFNTVVIRDALVKRGLTYGAGIGRFGRPLFFLGQVIGRETREGCEIVICGEELARGATAPPAMSRGQEVLIRQDALERWLWTRYEEWQLHPRANGLAAAYELHAAAMAAGADTSAVIRQMALTEREALILHELGERRVDAELGDDWHDLLDDLQTRKAEVLARSIRDLLADSAVTLPTLLASGAVASVHCWFGLLDGVRLVLAPGLLDAYQRWHAGDPAALSARLGAAHEHYAAAAARLLAAWHQDGAPGVEALIDDEGMIFH